MKLAETFTPTAYIVLCTQKRLFLVKKRLLHQILSIDENTRTWFDILAVQKCQLHCFQFGSARLAMWIVTRSARFTSVRLGSVRLGLARLAVRMSPKGVCVWKTKFSLVLRWSTVIITYHQIANKLRYEKLIFRTHFPFTAEQFTQYRI